MATKPVSEIVRQVKPLLSTTKEEARGRVIKLYKLWYRHIPTFVIQFRLQTSVSEARAKLREEFLKHKAVNDVRVIDMLVIKGQMNFQEMFKKHKQTCHAMYIFKCAAEPQSKDFLSKFIAGVD